MVQPASFSYFTDLTQEACFLWASDSIEDCLGYTPEEIVGLSAYSLVSKEDVLLTHASHYEHVVNDFVASQAMITLRHKDGGRVLIEAAFSTCHDFIACCAIVLEADAKNCKPTPVKCYHRHLWSSTSSIGS